MDDNIDKSYISCPMECDHLSYEFESFLIAFARISEAVIVDEVKRYFDKSNRKKFENAIYKKNDIDGLYWRINILRNRAAHSTGGYYETGMVSNRYVTMDSKVRIIQVVDGQIVLNTLMIDLTKSDYVKKVIKEEIIIKESKENIIDILFSQRTPKGKGKKSSYMLFPKDFPYFDLNSGLLSLMEDAFDYIDSLLKIYENSMIYVLERL